jgi:hypothetical protein
MFLLALIFLLLPLNPIDAQYSGLFGSYTYTKVLVSNVYNLFWNVTSDSLIAEIQVKTAGLLGFGISPTGGMDGSDLIVARINSNGKTNFTDRHIIERNVLIDSEQNWFLLNNQKLNGYITIQI